jgi:hypothetical protein
MSTPVLGPALGVALGVVSDPFSLMCALCFMKYASTVAFHPGARCGATSEKQPDGCVGKLIPFEFQGAKQPRRERRKRGSVEAPKADAEEAASETATR